MVPPLITLEEHFISTINGKEPHPNYSLIGSHLNYVIDQLKDLDKIRLKEMEKGAVTLQVISHAPSGTLSPEQCHMANEQLAKAVAAHPTRFAGFAVLPMGDPDEAAKELAHCMEEYGFLGALIDNHWDGKYYDGPEYHIFWHMVQSLGVPVYLHPAWATDQMLDLNFSGNFPHTTSVFMSASGWGWHNDVAVHIFKLFSAGLFDKFPRLKIVIGHFGEMIPFMLERINQLSPRWGKRERVFQQVYDENLWLTVSGVWSLNPLKCMLGNTKIERILYSVDYPFAKNEWGLKWIQDLEESGFVTKEQLEMIAYKNAENLLGIKAYSEPQNGSEEQKT